MLSSVVVFTKPHNNPAADASIAQQIESDSQKFRKNNTKQSPKKSAQYSINEDRLHCREKGLNKKIMITPLEATEPKSLRARHQSGIKHRVNQMRLAKRFAASAPRPKYLIMMAAEYWKRGNSNGTSQGEPKMGNFGCNKDPKPRDKVKL
jgi:hypothetical protein